MRKDFLMVSESIFVGSYGEERPFAWIAGKVVAFNSKHYAEPIVVVETPRHGSGIFRFRHSELVYFDLFDGSVLEGRSVVIKATRKPEDDSSLAEMKKYPMILLAHFPDHENQTMESLCHVLSGKDDPTQHDLIPYGEVLLLPHARQRIEERKLDFREEDMDHIRRIAVKYLKMQCPYAEVVMQKRYVAVVSCFPRLITTMLPYDEEQIREKNRRRPGLIEFVN